MKDNYTHIAIVLDRSGSMSSIKEDTIGGVNTFLEAQKSAEGEATITLAQFDNQYELLENFVPVENVPLLTEQTFIPRGGTALQDAIGLTVTSVGEKLASMAEDERPEKVVVCIVTDGEENSSRVWTPSRVKELVEKQTNDYNWEFVFIGANQDAVVTSQDLGFSAGKTMTYAANSRGTKSAYESLAANVSSMRSTKSMLAKSAAMDFTASQKSEQKDAGAVA